jgi:hypothetical protein
MDENQTQRYDARKRWWHFLLLFFFSVRRGRDSRLMAVSTQTKQSK